MIAAQAVFQLTQCDIEYILTKEQKEAYKMAIKALHKQIPEKTKYGDGYCPCCELELEEEWKYCPNCGQKIDWSEIVMYNKESTKLTPEEIKEKWCSTCVNKVKCAEKNTDVTKCQLSYL